VSRIVSLLMVSLLAVASVVHAETVVYDRILVKINDTIVTQYDLDEEMRPILAKIKGRTLSSAEQKQLDDLRNKALENLVDSALLAQEIVKYDIQISDESVDNEIEDLKKKRQITDEEFLEMVKNDGLTLDEFRQKLKKNMEKQDLLGYQVHSKVLVTDSEIQAEYESRHDDYLLGKMVELGIILLPPDVAAEEVRMRIKDGELTFAEAVEKYSVGPGKDNGGSIGEMGWDDIADDWKASIEGVSEGGVGSPLTVQGKEALLSPLKVVEDRLVPLDEVRDGIFNQLMEQKREKLFKDYFDKLKQESVIIYMNNPVEPENGVSE